VILTSDDQDVAILFRLQADIVVGVSGIPVECRWNGALWDARSNHICAIRRLFAMDSYEVVDGTVGGDYCRGTLDDEASFCVHADRVPVFYGLDGRVRKQSAIHALEHLHQSGKILEGNEIGPVPETAGSIPLENPRAIR
jgi:hypothetical protein